MSKPRVTVHHKMPEFKQATPLGKPIPVKHTIDPTPRLTKSEIDATEALMELKTPRKGGYILSRRSRSTKSRTRSRSRRTRSKRHVSRARTTRYLKKYE